MVSKKYFKKLEKKIQSDGWVVFKNCYKKKIIDDIRSDLFSKVKLYKTIQDYNNLAGASNNAQHHIILTSNKSMKLIDPNPLHKFLEFYFDGRYILNTMGSTFVKPKEKVYTQNIHRDVRSFYDANKMMVLAIFLLDDSTEKNGATWIMPGSNKLKSKPSAKEFYKNSIRILGKKGDIILFDGNFWHSSGENITNRSRVIVSAAFTKPYIKQQIDYPRAFGFDFQHRISKELKQILGFNAMTPSSIEEYYKPKNLRFYQSDQG